MASRAVSNRNDGTLEVMFLVGHPQYDPGAFPQREARLAIYWGKPEHFVQGDQLNVLPWNPLVHTVAGGQSHRVAVTRVDKVKKKHAGLAPQKNLTLRQGSGRGEIWKAGFPDSSGVSPKTGNRPVGGTFASAVFMTVAFKAASWAGLVAKGDSSSSSSSLLETGAPSWLATALNRALKGLSPSVEPEVARAVSGTFLSDYVAVADVVLD